MAEALGKGRCKIDPLREAGLLVGTDRDADRIKLVRYVLSHPESVPIAQVWRHVFGHDGPVDPADADYQLTRRFYTGHPEYFQITNTNGMTAVESTLSLLDLISLGITQKRRSTGVTTDRDFCETMLRGTDALTDTHKSILERSLRRYVDRIKDWRLLFEAEHMRTGATTTLIKPYTTRFTDRGRIGRQWARYRGALDHAGETYDNAVMVTLTSDPKRHDSLDAAIGEINPMFNRLLSWMAYEPTTKPTSRPGYRPPYIKFLEFSEAGYPHLHVLFFDVPERDDGMPWLIDKQELSDRWADLGQGEIVDLKPLVYRDDLSDAYDEDSGFVSYYDHADGEDPGTDVMAWESGTTAGQYLGKYLSATFGGILELATDGGIDVEGAYSEKSSAYKVAMYWATNRRLWSISRDIEQGIKVDDDEQDLPIRIRFLGAYPFWDLPSHVLLVARPYAEYAEARYPDQPEGESDVDRPPPSVTVTEL